MRKIRRTILTAAILLVLALSSVFAQTRRPVLLEELRGKDGQRYCIYAGGTWMHPYDDGEYGRVCWPENPLSNYRPPTKSTAKVRNKR